MAGAWAEAAAIGAELLVAEAGAEAIGIGAKLFWLELELSVIEVEIFLQI